MTRQIFFHKFKILCECVYMSIDDTNFSLLGPNFPSDINYLIKSGPSRKNASL